jgi:hypothetical protein
MTLGEAATYFSRLAAKYGAHVEIMVHGPEGPTAPISGFGPEVNYYCVDLTLGDEETKVRMILIHGVPLPEGPQAHNGQYPVSTMEFAGVIKHKKIDGSLL